MLLSSDAGCGCAAGARRGALGRGAARFAARRGAALRALRLAVRFALRLADFLTAFFFDIFLLDALRDFAAFFAVFRRFLAMRAPPIEWARILSDKLIARVLILRVLLSCLLVAPALPVFADQAGAAKPAAEPRMPFEKGTIEITALGGVSLPISLFRAKSDHQLAMASLAIGRVMAGGPGKGSLELLVDVTPFFHVSQTDWVRVVVRPLFIRWTSSEARGSRVIGEGAQPILRPRGDGSHDDFNIMHRRSRRLREAAAVRAGRIAFRTSRMRDE